MIGRERLKARCVYCTFTLTGMEAYRYMYVYTCTWLNKINMITICNSLSTYSSCGYFIKHNNIRFHLNCVVHKEEEKEKTMKDM